jgi:hypothetical protein
MKSLRKAGKIISAFLLVNFLSQLFLPTVSYALTAGPTSPEFSSFEPVDTTDMVNLASGEFIYNNPILEVPGPEGGYPLSLSYHAGIKLDQEASWVGLGWTLNPGAINRSVNGFPDDNVDSKRIVKDYWGGGEQTTKTYSVGLNIPSTGIGISYTRAKTTDSYKGFSSNSYLGLSQNVLPTLSLGVSISSKGSQVSLGEATLNFDQKNNLAGKISSFSKETDKGFYATNFGSLGLKEFYTRYWSDETQSLTTYGALYPGLANLKIGEDYYASAPTSEFQSYAFDTYDVYDDRWATTLNSPTSNEVHEPNDLARQMGGTLPAYDRFDVLGQGIGGVMQPIIFENGDLFGQSLYERGINGEPANKYPVLGYQSLRKFSNKKVDFKFLNEFSNSLNITPGEISENNQLLSVSAHQIAALEKGFNNTGQNQKLAGSRHIEWFSNAEIVNGGAQQQGFVDFYENRSDRKLSFEIYENYLQPEACLPSRASIEYGKGRGSFKSDTYEEEDIYKDLTAVKFPSLKPRPVDLSKKIGGFMITNESGVTYHYALPVFNYNEYTKSKLKNPRNGAPTFREYKNDDPYAYTWLLTAVTGPDYIDKDANGILSDQDLGYWVKFDYGRWADAYQWRTPQSGYMDDIESEYETFSYGVKELYYLDAVETRTHKAIFIKSKRKDGKGVTSRLEGGSNPRQYTSHYKTSATGTEFASVNFSVSPVSTMKLDAIYLFDKDDLATLSFNKTNGQKYREATTTTPYLFPYVVKPNQQTTANNYPNLKEGEDAIKVKYHNGDKVYDDGDISNKTDFIKKSLRVVQFDSDYSLTKGTPNSIGFFSDIKNEFEGAQCAQPINSTCVPTDDFNFEWPQFLGHACANDRLPWEPSSGGYGPYCCGDSYASNKAAFYSNNPLGNFGFSNNSQQCAQANSDYKGATITYFHTGKLTLKGLRFFGKGGTDLIPPTSFVYNNLNPDYEKDKFDEWDYYKSDYNSAIAGYTRKITPASAANLSAWSLSSITSPLGSSMVVEYEPQQYRKSVYNDFTTFSIESAIPVEGSTTNVRIIFKEKEVDLTKWFSVGASIDIKSMSIYDLTGLSIATRGVYKGNSNDAIVSVGSNEVVVTSEAYKTLLTKTTETLIFIDPNGNGSGQTTQVPAVPYFVAGFVKALDTSIKYAGGVRVKSLSIKDALNENKTEYSYTLTSDNSSSGITSFKPYNQLSVQYPQVEYFNNIFSDDDAKGERQYLESARYAFQWLVDDAYSDLLSFSREAPGPGPIYEYVTVKNKTNGQLHDKFTVHHFKVFEKEMISRAAQTESSSTIQKRTVTIKNNASDIGNILSVTTYDNISQQAVMQKKYGYLFDQDTKDYEQTIANTKQGTVHQSFHKSVLLNKYKVNVDWGNWFSKTDISVDILSTEKRAIVTKREDRANALTSIEEIDYKKDLSTRKENHAFDFYSGQILKEVSIDSYGNKKSSEIVPAYSVKNTDNVTDVYPDLGLKIYNVQNKNMLTQPASTTSYVLNSQNEIGLLSASIETWSNQVPVLGLQSPQSGIWRKQSSYQWNGQLALNPDGSYPQSDFTAHPFNWSNPDGTANANWEKTNHLTLYDPYSHALETKDVNGNYTSTRMDPKQERAIASTVNAAYNEMASSGIEHSDGNATNEGGVNRGAGNPTTVRAHTGKYSLLVNANTSGFNFTVPTGSKKYHASVWVYVPGEAETQTELDKVQLVYSVNGVEKKASPKSQKNKSKSWYLINLDIDPQGTAVQVKCRNNSVRGVYFDDFRVHPLDASMTSYVYDSFSGELNYILDGNNFYTRFEYDAMGRLIRTSKELLNFDFGDGKESFRADQKVKEAKYNYGKNTTND